MASTSQKYPTIRIKAETHKLIKQLAEEDDIRMSEVIDEAVERYRRQRIARKANEIWNEAMKDPELKEIWAKEDEEIELTFWSPIKDPWEEDEELSKHRER